MKRFKVDKKQSLLGFLHKTLDVSKKEIKRQIESNACQVNGSVELIASRVVDSGDLIEWTETALQLVSGFETARVLYQDEDLLVYNKPVGITSEEIKTGAFLVHRLDKGTSGALLFAKNRESEKALLEAFKERCIEKGYLAVVEGVPNRKKGVIDNYLGKIGSIPGQTLYGKVSPKQGKHAITYWALQRVYPKKSLLACHPKTGRTHQIRVHLAEIGHPIIGDYQYGNRLIKASRMMLHAYQISFLHPRTKQKLLIKAPIPKDFIF